MTTMCKVWLRNSSRNRDLVVEIPGEQIGFLTVAPLIGKSGQLSKRVFAVRFAEDGTRIAAFVDQRIARQFACRLVADYGDALIKASRANLRCCEDAEDSVQP